MGKPARPVINVKHIDTLSVAWRGGEMSPAVQKHQPEILGEEITISISSGSEPDTAQTQTANAMDSDPGIEHVYPRVDQQGCLGSTPTEIIDLCGEESESEVDSSVISPVVQDLIPYEVGASSERTISKSCASSSGRSRSTPEPIPAPLMLHAHSEALPTPVGIKQECLEHTAANSPGEDNSDPGKDLSQRLPANLLDQVDEWYDHNPGRRPPFATTFVPNISLYEDAKGVSASYWHKSGKVLDVMWYDLPKHLYPSLAIKKTYFRVKVARGHMLSPCFFRCAQVPLASWAKGKGTMYKAWAGFEGLNKDGFEFEPSIFKSAGTKDTNMDPVSDLASETTSDSFQPLHKSLRTNRKPPQLYTGLVNWFPSRNPPAKIQAEVEEDEDSTEDLLQSSMEPVEPKESHNLSQRTNMKLLRRQVSSTSTNLTKRPSSAEDLIQQLNKKPRLADSVSANDVSGLKPRSSERIGHSKSRSLVGNFKDHDDTSSIKSRVAITIVPPKSASLEAGVHRAGDYTHKNSLNTAKQRPSNEFPAPEWKQAGRRSTTDRISAITRTTSKPIKQGTGEAGCTAHYTEIDTHIRENTVVLFYANRTRLPRPLPQPRMMSACDSVGKLFAQAKAGAVFPQSIEYGDVKALAIKINNCVDILPMVQDDGEDFETFVSALRQATCWTKDAAGHLSGSCTVEVRALV